MKNKKKMVALIACICVLMSGMGVYAATVEYNITVNSAATNQDNLSKKVLKNTDGDLYFYVTPTYFNTNNASFWATSKQKGGSAVSRKIYVENGLNETRDGMYINNYAPGNVNYYMQTEYGYSSTGTVISKGRYTP